MGIKSLALFGSVARNEAKPDSDIDLLIKFYPDKYPQRFIFFNAQSHL
ncbi:MAG TPA: nucleotidyltransferase domain-containing protein [Allocoleopsis sp.]